MFGREVRNVKVICVLYCVRRRNLDFKVQSDGEDRHKHSRSLIFTGKLGTAIELERLSVYLCFCEELTFTFGEKGNLQEHPRNT